MWNFISRAFPVHFRGSSSLASSPLLFIKLQFFFHFSSSSFFWLMKEFKSFTNNVFFFEIIEMHKNNYLEQNYVVKRKKTRTKMFSV